MTTLATAVQNRYSAEYLKKITNPDARGTKTLNSTLLEQAVTDATAEFKTLCNQTLDATDVQHLRVACPLVVLILEEWGAASQAATEKRRSRVETMAEQLRKVTSHKRITPKSGSVKVPSREKAGGLPDMDRKRFRDVVPESRPESDPDVD